MSDSLITKRALAKTLKELCQYRNFEKISINDLTNKCGLNRQTFYYHFQDKYDLLQWLYYDELFADIENIITFDNWDQCLLTVLEKNISRKRFFILALSIPTNNIFIMIYIIWLRNVFMMRLLSLM
ncbi:MAG: TetR family transcriptional regulator [Thomasclavelia ramosa]